MILYSLIQKIGRCTMNITVNQPILWGDKRYYALNYYLRNKYKQKVFKISLDAGFTCPNRDGSLAKGGCYFCSASGSGDFAGKRSHTIDEQFANIKQSMQRKWAKGKYIAYFQAFTNTYAPVEVLKALYEEAIKLPDVVGLAIATRPDCLDKDTIALLAKLNQKTNLWVELGLQTVHEKTSKAMNMHYNYADFSAALLGLQAQNIKTVTHIILGLPGESIEDMSFTANTIADLPIQGLKIHLLHLMLGTPLANLYANSPFPFLSKEVYVNLVADILEIISPEIVIHRLTGDSPRDLLIGPQWSLNKWEVLNSIEDCLVARDTWQGKYYKV